MKFDQGVTAAKARRTGEGAQTVRLSRRRSCPSAYRCLYVAPSKAAGPHEALQIGCQSGWPDIDRMAELLGTTNRP